MKTKAIYIGAVAVLVALCVRGEVLNRCYQAVLVDASMKSQMEAIKRRAQDFMEMNLHQSFAPIGEDVSFLRRYELRIRVPTGKLPEFLDWMRNTSMQAVTVDGWPSSAGTQIDFGNDEFSYIVYYGQKPSDWRQARTR